MKKVPIATYRLQFHAGFTFEDAARVVPYLAELGVSDLYASPCFQAMPGSSHGYHVVNPNRVDGALGGREGHETLCRTLRDKQMGCIQDVVPNHMAVNSPENIWWWDVLEKGVDSRYAEYFDIDWGGPERKSPRRILLPVLGDHYGRVLESGEIQLRNDQEKVWVVYQGNHFPISPHALGDLLEEISRRAGSDELAFLADALHRLSSPPCRFQKNQNRLHRHKAVILERFHKIHETKPEAAKALEDLVKEINGDAERLHALLEAQHYRLAFWKTASHEVGFRRFFDINTLVGLRMEDADVFENTHRTVLEWIRDGSVQGLRIDHIDGMRDPEQYLCRLREKAPEAWIVAEKILHPGEALPANWPIDGTTGYDFMTLVGGLFVDPDGEKAFSDFYTEFTGECGSYRKVVREKKHRVMKESFGGEITRLSQMMMRICTDHPRYRDFGRDEIKDALAEIIACFPVYRSYIRRGRGHIRGEDKRNIQRAVTAAKGNRPDIDPELFDFLQSILLREFPGHLETELITRFQQTTGPITAKGVEDTAFYCFNRFISLNEVGGAPSFFGVSVETFHQGMAERAKRYPVSMLATSTHDTKRSEDVRARLSLLSEIPERWAAAVRLWSVHNEPYRQNNIPDRNTEYFLYQTLVGAWPIGKERLSNYMLKAVKEAKVHTSWVHPDPEYEDRVRHFTESVVSDPVNVSVLRDFVEPLVNPGRINSMAQTLIKLTAPGIPDIYQGTELWDFSLVDPDNRRPVDFEMRAHLLTEMQSEVPARILDRMDEGSPKLWVVLQALGIRNEYPQAFISPDYQPLFARGTKSSHVVAFLRGDAILSVVPRLILGLNGDWGDTSLAIPEGRWHNRLTHEELDGGPILMADLFRRFPVALLVHEQTLSEQRITVGGEIKT